MRCGGNASPFSFVRRCATVQRYNLHQLNALHSKSRQNCAGVCLVVPNVDQARKSVDDVKRLSDSASDSMRKILIFAIVLIPFVVNRVTTDDYDWDVNGDGNTTSERIAAFHANHSVFGAAVSTIMSNNPALQSFVTPAVRALVRRRLTSKAALVTEDMSLNEKEKLSRKVALLLVHEVNPYEEFFPAEEALIRGMTVDTLNSEKRRTRALKNLAG
jgi:hypothetical protein